MALLDTTALIDLEVDRRQRCIVMPACWHNSLEWGLSVLLRGIAITNTTSTDRTGITFAVDEVTPATELLKECRAYEAVKQMLDSDIESCGDYHSTVVADIRYQPLLAAVHTAFSQHRPLVLSPDAIWVTIAQGVAHHMALHGERLRSRFVAHQGKLDLIFECHDWPERSPENPWPEAFALWSSQIRQHVGSAVHDVLACDFSTTGPVERAVSDVVMMDVFNRYFHYEMLCICGIPKLTLEGSPADWQHLREKAAGLSIFDMDWWLEHLLPICDQFARASRGGIDRGHWQAICKRQEAYGGDIINGWIAKLFPYLRAFINGPCTRRNPIFETGEGFQSFDAPSGLSRVPFTWRNATTGRERRMEAIGGVVGMTQDGGTLALRPKVGWAVREAEKLDVLLAKLAERHVTFEPAVMEEKDVRGFRSESKLPRDLSAFYHQTNGAELFANRGFTAAFRIVPRKQIEPLDWGEPPCSGTRGPGGRTWFRIASLADGSWLAINLDLIRHDPRPQDFNNWIFNRLFNPICHCSANTIGLRSGNPVIAYSFTELLERLLESNGEPYWLAPAFGGYGDADQYNRWE